MASGIAKAQSSQWTCDERSFEYSMSLYISASLYHNDISDFSNYEIGAFCSEECRGLLSIQETGTTKYGYLRVRSNSLNGESIIFKLYDKQNNKVILCDSIVPFVANERIGFPSEPYHLNFGNGYVITVESSNPTYGSVSGGGEFNSGDQVTLLATPNDGYHFEKWSNDVTDNPYVFSATENLTLTAIFQPNQYKLVYKVDNEVYKSFDVDYASEITPEAGPTKEGYTFSGWSEIPKTMPSHDVEVVGSFTINQYKVTFVVDGVTVKEDMLDFGSKITAPENPSKTGYSFSGWSPAVDSTVPAHDVTYVAQFSINQYTITFDTDGGSEIAPITQNYNTSITAPTNPTKTGYTFAGWDKEIPATMPAENITIKALWTINKYMLTYKVDGEVYKQYEVEYNATITPETAPEKEGHTFSGWSEIPTTMPANDVEVNGTYTINQYKVTFVVEGVTVKEEMLDFGSAISAPENPTKTGHTFTGWNPAVDTTVPSHDVTYVAQFTINQYTITFDTDGGSEIAPITQNYNTAITTPADPTKTGYTFAGWDKAIPATMPAENITIKAIWTINKYMLTYKVDGNVYKQYEVEYNAAITPETEPTKEGYTFSGWSEIPAAMPANDVEVNGTFTINQYRVSFVVDGVTVKEEKLDFGSAIVAPANPTKVGYTFTGWNPALNATVPAHDVTYVAQFTVNQYTITFDTDGGSEIAPITQDYNSVVTAPANPTKTGYTFAGWDKEIPTLMPAENITIKALWTINQYTITFDTDGGSEIAPITQNFNTAITAPADPTKIGYTFSGWDKEIPTTMPAENITIKALWTINKYMLTYKVDGEVYKQYEVEYNATITPEAAPEKEGHTFSGWSEIPATMPANDIEINGTFSVNKYLLTYKVDGEIYHQDSVAFGTAIVLIDEPFQDGKTFSGWKGAPETMPAHDVTIVGSFNSNVYTLTYKVDGEVYKSVQYEFGESIIPEPELTKEGHTFLGWSEIPETMPAHDVEVNGAFYVNQYIVTFMVDGERIKQVTLDFGSKITAPDDPTKVGYTFIGWNPTVDATVPAHDVTYEAMFEINTYKLTYYVDGDLYKEFEIEFGTEIIPEENPVKEGYNFSGWSEIPQFMPDHNVEVYGTFTISTGINSVKSESNIEKVYDLSGNRMIHTKKGINIINGKKIMIR